MLTHPTGWLYVSQGRTDLIFRWGLAAGTAIIIAIGAGAYAGTAYAVAVAYLVVNSLLFAPAMALGGSLIEARLPEVLRVIAGPALSSLAMAALVTLVDRGIPARVPAWCRLTAEVTLGAGIYGLTVYRAKLESLRELTRHIRDRYRSTRRAVEPTGDLAAVTRED